MKKDLIRKIYLKKREDLNSATLSEYSSNLINNTLCIFEEFQPKCLHCFLTIHSRWEINTKPIIEYCWKNKIDVLVPVCNFKDSTFKNAEFLPHTKIKKDKYNISVPIDPIWRNNDSIDIVITPLLAFDLKGYRVGYGRGFYDRFFYSLHKNVKRVGISFFDPLKDIDDTNEYDIPLTHCITPKKIYIF